MVASCLCFLQPLCCRVCRGHSPRGTHTTAKLLLLLLLRTTHAHTKTRSSTHTQTKTHSSTHTETKTHSSIHAHKQSHIRIKTHIQRHIHSHICCTYKATILQKYFYTVSFTTILIFLFSFICAFTRICVSIVLLCVYV